MLCLSVEPVPRVGARWGSQQPVRLVQVPAWSREQTWGCRDRYWLQCTGKSRSAISGIATKICSRNSDEAQHIFYAIVMAGRAEMMKDIPLKPVVLTSRLPYCGTKCHWSKRKQFCICWDNSELKCDALWTHPRCIGRNKALWKARGRTTRKLSWMSNLHCHLWNVLVGRRKSEHPKLKPDLWGFP